MSTLRWSAAYIDSTGGAWMQRDEVLAVQPRCTSTCVLCDGGAHVVVATPRDPRCHANRDNVEPIADGGR